MSDVCKRCGDDHSGSCQVCEGRGCFISVEEINVESFELTGKILCPDCVDEDFAARAEWETPE